MYELIVRVLHYCTRNKLCACNQQRLIAEQVRAFVANHMFCKIKFIRNDAMVHDAMKMVMDHEQVSQEQPYAFQTVYTYYAFNFALNSKQSTCETTGKKCVVDETLPKLKRQKNCSQLRSCASSDGRKPSARR